MSMTFSVTKIPHEHKPEKDPSAPYHSIMQDIVTSANNRTEHLSMEEHVC